MTAGFLRAVAPGPHVTIQDSGRHGWRRFGVSGSGAMDFPSLAIANSLVGNSPDEAALEFGQIGGTWEVQADSVRIAIAGGAFGCAVGGVPLGAWRSHMLRRGEILSIRSAADAVWGYLAVAGGFDIPPQLGSRSTHLRSRVGGITGARLDEGDQLPLRLSTAPDQRERRIAPPVRGSGPLRVVLGPQDDYFAAEALATFFTADYLVTHRGDRMGTWLEGPPVAHRHGFNVLSDGLVPGCIQIPGARQPVVLMMDCQTIGGYPKLATMVSADLPRFAQTRPGSMVRFTAIEIEDAQRLYRSYQSSFTATLQAVAEIPARRVPFWLRG